MISIGTGHSSGTVGTDTQTFPTVEESPAAVERVRPGEDWHTCAVPDELIPARVARLQAGASQKVKGGGKTTSTAKSKRAR